VGPAEWQRGPRPGHGFSRAAGYTFEQVDAFLGNSASRLDCRVYKPFPFGRRGLSCTPTWHGGHSVGADARFFPTETNMVFPGGIGRPFDPGPPVSKIKPAALLDGKSFVITIRLLRRSRGQWYRRHRPKSVTRTGRSRLKEFGGRGGGAGALASATAAAQPAIIIPELDYITNDVWMRASGPRRASRIRCCWRPAIAKGHLVCPDDPGKFRHLYNLPASV